MPLTELGMEIDVSEEQSEKANSPMLVTELGIVIDVSEEHPLFVAYADNQRIASNKVEKC